MFTQIPQTTGLELTHNITPDSIVTFEQNTDPTTGIEQIIYDIPLELSVREPNRRGLPTFDMFSSVILNRLKQVNQAILPPHICDFLSSNESQFTVYGLPYNPHDLLYKGYGTRRKRRTGFKDNPLECYKITYKITHIPPTEDKPTSLIALECSGFFVVSGHPDTVSTSTRLIQLSPEGQILGTTFTNKVTSP